MNEERKIPKADPRFAFLEHGDDQYTPLIQIRVTEDGMVFKRSGNMAILMEHLTVKDIENVIKDRGQGEYQLYDYILNSMNEDKKAEARRKG